MFNLDEYGGPGVFRWTREHLYNVLTSGHNKVVKNPRLAKALNSVDRADFIEDKQKDLAYQDIAIDIGFTQTLSKPTITAFMLELLNPKAGARVLDIGTGAGYSAAILSIMIGPEGKVFTVERLQYLIDIAKSNIEKYQEIKNIEFVFRDGTFGLPQRAPFDAIHVSAAFDEVPQELKDQINVGGRLVAPIGERQIVLIERVSAKQWKETLFWGEKFERVVEGVN